MAQPQPKGKNPVNVLIGRMGGKARLRTMTPEARREVARKAALVRWGKRDPVCVVFAKIVERLVREAVKNAQSATCASH